jgi:hypothetical protein
VQLVAAQLVDVVQLVDDVGRLVVQGDAGVDAELGQRVAEHAVEGAGAGVGAPGV